MSNLNIPLVSFQKVPQSNLERKKKKKKNRNHLLEVTNDAFNILDHTEVDRVWGIRRAK